MRLARSSRRGASSSRRDPRHRRLPHGVLPRPGRERAHAPSTGTRPADEHGRQLLERYYALPLPTTTGRALALHRSRRASIPTRSPSTPTGIGTAALLACSSSTTAGTAFASEAGIEIAHAPDGRHVSQPLDGPRAARHARRRGGQVHRPERGALAARPARPRAARASWSSKPLYVRVVELGDGGALFWRLLVVAEEGSRLTLIEEYASASSSLSGYCERSCRALRRPGGEARVRVDPEPLPGDVAFRLPPRPCRPRRASSTGSPAASARSSGKMRIENDLAGRGRPSRVTGTYFADGTSTSTTTRSRSTPRPTRRRTSRSGACCATTRARCGAG